MLPEITFSENITPHIGEQTVLAFTYTMQIQIVILYFTKNNVLHMGDTYFAMHYPYIDLKSGASVNGYMEAHKRALLLIDEHTKFIPGHGTSSNKKELETNVLMLENTQNSVLKAIKDEKTLEGVI